MKTVTVRLIAFAFVCADLLGQSAEVWSQQPASPIERYCKLEFTPTEENFDKGWQDRVGLEFEIINSADLAALRIALKDENAFVRSMAARALGIRADKYSAQALAELVESDPEYMVRIRAVEALAYLKMKPKAIELATKDRQAGVQWTAKIVAGQLASDTDYAAEVRQAFAAGIKREVMASAKVGERAPDFTAQALDGKAFKLSDVLGKKPIAIYFAAFDG
jgi:hypothetical protein